MGKSSTRPLVVDLKLNTAYLLNQQTSAQTFESRLIYFQKSETESWLRGWVEVHSIRGASSGRCGYINAKKVIGGRTIEFVVFSKDVNDPWRLSPQSIPFELADSDWKEKYQAECLRRILSLEESIEHYHKLADAIKNSNVY